ncbi:hypothetical protein, partial [Ligilactobacillus ruminis]|uniref:hypothetical protein n=1 Tax=Ligilactobacillus ruminis TaxID=1623 RepID=UPI001CDB3F1D
CSTFGAARGGFGVGGRTFFQFLENLFYFRSPRSEELDARVDKIWQKGVVFVCPSVRAAIAIVLPVTEDRHLRANLQNHRFSLKPVLDIE